MPTINQLSATTSLTTSDKMVVYSQDNGDARKATLSTLVDFMSNQLGQEGLTTQIVTPVNAQTITISAQTNNYWLILTPAGPLATLTVALPPLASCFDNQEVSVATQSNGVTTLTVQGSGATVYGSPGSLLAGAYVTFKFNAQQQAWYATQTSTNQTSFSAITITQSINDANGNESIKFHANASAVNEITVNNAVAGGSPGIEATGSDTNISLNLLPKGSGNVLANGVPVVSTSGTQTLTNKTLTSPVLNTPTLASSMAVSGATTDIGTNGNRLRKLWATDADITTAAIDNGEFGADVKLHKSTISGTTSSNTAALKISTQNTVTAWATLKKPVDTAFSAGSHILRNHNFNGQIVATTDGNGNSVIRCTFQRPMANGDYAVIVSGHNVDSTGQLGMRLFEVVKLTNRFDIYVWHWDTETISVLLNPLGNQTITFGNWKLINSSATSGVSAAGFYLDVAVIGDQA